MSKSLRKRLCWNCEGEVVLSEEVCPFCGVSVVPACLEGPGDLFAPPYSNHFDKDLEVPKSPYDLHGSHPAEQTAPLASNEEESEPALDDFKRGTIAIILLLSGSVFLLFSLALALFSQNGTFTLQWDGTFWYVYAIVALPLLAIGWASLMKLEK